MSGLIYNVTLKLNGDIAPEWVRWMHEIHIPEVMATACFKSYRFTHLRGYDDDEGITFAVQYVCPSQELFDIYQAEHAPALQARAKEKFDGKFVVFRTILEIISEG